MKKNKSKINRLLDLDALNPSIGDVKIGGKRHKMFQPAYEDFVLLPILFDQLGQMESLDTEENKREKMEQIERMREIVKRIIPSLDQNILTFGQLMRIVQYVSEKFGEQMEEEYGVAAEDAGKGKQE